MTATARVLDLQPVADLAAYEAAGGGVGLRAAVEGGADAVLAVVAASGLRGRGGAGFPTATKWRSVVDHRSPSLPTTVVVNAAEGEPGSYKDRAIIDANPYRVLEGALIAALVVGADAVVVATKARFGAQVARLRAAADELAAAGWAPGTSIDVVEGPEEYLFGEETALLEVVEGRLPFPRIAPPWRRGVDDDVDDSAQPAATELAGAGTEAAPALINNVETLANVALIVANGPEWFRSVGTEASPGTVVCTVTGAVARAGVVEVAMGTTLRALLEEVGGRPVGDGVTAVLSGVSNPLLGGELLDTPLTYEAMAAAGSGLGSCGFIVLGDRVDPVAVAHGVSRFLAVESCGQCTPCKQDGRAVAEALDRLRRDEAGPTDLEAVTDHLRTIDEGARCSLATQHQQVVGSLLERFPEAFAARTEARGEGGAEYLVAELDGFVDGAEGPEAVVDERHRAKQPDWTHDATDSGRSPADRLDQADPGHDA